MLAVQIRTYIKGTDQTRGPIWNYATWIWHPGKGTKPDRVIELNSQEMSTHASCKTTRTWDSFNNRGTKMSLLSDELWLIANNLRIIQNNNSIFNNSNNLKKKKSNKSISNLGLCKHSEHCHGSNGIKIQIWQGKIYQPNKCRNKNYCTEN